MGIHEFVWPQDRIDHIARHGVAPEEVEEICFGRPLVQRARSQGENPVLYVLGQTDVGRYLFALVIQFPDGHNSAPNDRQRRTPIPAALALYGFYTSLGGRPLFGSASLSE